jgi:hypothetical protein
MQKIPWRFARLGFACVIVLFALETFGQTPGTDSTFQPDCIMSSSTPDGSLTVCLLHPEPGSHQPLDSEKIEILKKSGTPVFITPGGAIREWHLWNEPDQIAVAFVDPDKTLIHALYDTSTGALVSKLDLNPADPSELPQWAKSRSELDDESVLESPELDAERTAWVVKIMDQALAIHPGMRRKNLDANFKTEGGISSRTQRQYVSKLCPIIKITVTFKPAGDVVKSMNEDPEDLIEAVSAPILQWSIYD